MEAITGTRQHATGKTGCGWVMCAPVDAKSKKWIVRSVSEEDAHNHPLGKDASYYHQHRKPTETMAALILSMTDNANKPAKISKEIRENDDGIVMTMTNIYNFRQKIFGADKNGSFSRLFEFLMNRGYIIRYRINLEKRTLDSVFVTHQSGLEEAHRFPEVVALDATYQSNRNRMPLINVVVVSNVGTEVPHSVLVASAFMVNEK